MNPTSQAAVTPEPATEDEPRRAGVPPDGAAPAAEIEGAEDARATRGETRPGPSVADDRNLGDDLPSSV